MQSALPQHSLQAFQQYEPFISQAIQNFPSPTVYRPKNCSTFSARIRDALKAMRLNGYTSTSFTYEECEKVFRSFGAGGEFVFYYGNDATVICGPSSRRVEQLTIETSVGVASSRPETADAQREDLFTAICTVKAAGLYATPVEFTNVTPAQYAFASANPLLEIFESSPGIYTLL